MRLVRAYYGICDLFPMYPLTLQDTLVTTDSAPPPWPPEQCNRRPLGGGQHPQRTRQGAPRQARQMHGSVVMATGPVNQTLPKKWGPFIKSSMPHPQTLGLPLLHHARGAHRSARPGIEPAWLWLWALPVSPSFMSNFPSVYAFSILVRKRKFQKSGEVLLVPQYINFFIFFPIIKDLDGQAKILW